MTLLDLFPGFMNLVLVVSLAGSPDRPHFLLGIIIPTTITVINNSWYWLFSTSYNVCQMDALISYLWKPTRYYCPQITGMEMKAQRIK